MQKEDIDKNDNSAIIEKFEPANVRDDFEYAFKMFSKALDIVLPKKEADPYINDFNYLGKKRFLIRNSYDGPGQSLKVDGKKVQQLIDDHVRALDIAELMDPREVTYKRFLAYAAKFKTKRARTALIKNKARQIIKELAPTNPVYYEKLRERLEKIIEEEEQRRKDDASYFNKLANLYNLIPYRNQLILEIGGIGKVPWGSHTVINGHVSTKGHEPDASVVYQGKKINFVGSGLTPPAAIVDDTGNFSSVFKVQDDIIKDLLSIEK